MFSGHILRTLAALRKSKAAENKKNTKGDMNAKVLGFHMINLERTRIYTISGKYCIKSKIIPGKYNIS